jgi:hypothetical protein
MDSDFGLFCIEATYELLFNRLNRYPQIIQMEIIRDKIHENENGSKNENENKSENENEEEKTAVKKKITFSGISM